MPKHWDDDRLRGKSGSGITIEGTTLEEFLDLEESKQDALDRERDLQADKQTIYRSNKPKYAETKERSGKGQSLPQETINREYWREMLMASIKSGKTLKALVLNALIDGTKMGCRDIQSRISHLGSTASVGSISGVMTALYKGPLNFNFLERDEDIEPRSKKKMYLYHINNFGRCLTIEQLCKIDNKRDPLDQFTIAYENSQLVSMGFEPVKTKVYDPPTKARKVRAAAKPEDTKKKVIKKDRATVKSPGILAPPITTNLPAIPSEINININFTFAFKMIKD